jgi:hypothetical protein
MTNHMIMVGLFGLHRCLGRIGQLVKFVEQISCKAGSRFAIHKISHHCWSPNVDCREEYCFRDLTPRSLVAISRLRGVLAQKSAFMITSMRISFCKRLSLDQLNSAHTLTL